jgi:plastocyanin
MSLLKRSLMHKVFSRAVVACLGIGICAAALPSRAQEPSVTLKFDLVKRGAGNQAGSGAESVPDASNIVVWLTPLNNVREASAAAPARRPIPQLVQRNKMFEPHVLVVETGTSVEFPNKDPFFHNVFSLFDGKRFDLGLYEAGTSKTVRFERPGVSFLFCNIHSDMSAIVVSVDTPYFALSDRSGRASIATVPDGRYQLHIWYERSLPEDLKNLERTITISASTRTLEPIQVIQNPDFNFAHKNKYGEDYVPAPTTGYAP